MVSGWRKTFCTSKNMPQNTEPTSLPDSDYYDNTDPCPRITSNFSLFSTPPSIPHTLRCPCPTNTKRTTPTSFHHHSTPSSPNSPSSTLSFLKATLHLTKSSCGICTHTVKFGQGKAIFTAECSHVFHFPCIAAHVRNHPTLTCPVCNANWKQLQNAHQNPAHHLKTTKSFNYNDDEPLMSPTSVSRFNPIPESNENEEEDDDEEDEEQQNDEPITFGVSPSLKTRNIEACFSPEAAIVASNRSSETYVALFKVKAPPRSATANRPPVDLVTVLDLSGNASGEDLRMLKRSMQVVISSLGSADRLSVVAFSAGSKRLFPLRKMTGRGQTAARRVVDALTALRCDGTPARSDALKKAAKVLEDRRQKNTVAKIILLTNNHEDQRLSSTRFPVHPLRISLDGACDQAHRESEFAKRVGNLLSVVAQDFRLELKLASRSAPAEIAAVYSLSKSFTAALPPGSAALGDLHAAEERELLLEFKVPGGTSSRGSQSQSHHHFISVRCSHRDPFTQELVNSKERELIVPRPHTLRSCDRLRRCHVSARAVAESRRLVARNDVCGAVQLLSSARASVSREQSDECLQWLEAELRSQKLRSGSNWMEEKGEPLTPMSAWRVAERLAKVAIMRKSMNRVSDLHGFEDARF